MSTTNQTQANQFNLHGKDLTVHYSTTSIAGVPLMSVEQHGTKKAFRGDEIQSLDSPLGQLVTVTLEAVPDLKTVTLTVVIPAVNLEGHGEQIHTFAAITTSRTSIGGPRLVKGQIQSYLTADLKGTAEYVVS